MSLYLGWGCFFLMISDRKITFIAQENFIVFLIFFISISIENFLFVNIKKLIKH